jgi:lipopolysaccharide assembly outer membrane protein LptD (OstA)
MTFEREGDWFGKGYIQTLEPRLYYVNIPYKDQRQIPLFDTGLADFNFAQIFAENRYSGLDRINDANQLTAAVATRLLDGDTGWRISRPWLANVIISVSSACPSRERLLARTISQSGGRGQWPGGAQDLYGSGLGIQLPGQC